jgi:hypothetical protein
VCLGRDAGWVMAQRSGVDVGRRHMGEGGPEIGFLRHIAADSVMLRPVDLHNCEGFAVYTPEQRRIGRVSHLIYGSDVDTPESVAVVRHGLTGTQTEVIPIGRIDLINATTQIVQLRDE